MHCRASRDAHTEKPIHQSIPSAEDILEHPSLWGGLGRPNAECCSSAEDWVNLPHIKTLPRGNVTSWGAKRGQKHSLLPFTLPITATATHYAGLCVQNGSSASLYASSCSTRINIKWSCAHKGCYACQLQRNLLLMSDFKALMSLQSSPLRLQSWTSHAWH